MSASYKDYGYQSAGLSSAYGYLIPALSAMLRKRVGRFSMWVAATV